MNGAVVLSIISVTVLAMVAIWFVWLSAAQNQAHSDEIHSIEIEGIQAAHAQEINRLERMLMLEDQRRYSDLAFERERVDTFMAALRSDRAQSARIAIAGNAADYGALERMANTPPEDLGAAERARAEVLANRRMMPPVEMAGGDPIMPHGAA